MINGLEYKDDTHEYFYQNAKKPSVTEILSRVGTQNISGYWNSASKVEFMSDDDAAYFGKEIHKIANYVVQGVSFTVNEEIEPYVEAIKRAVKYLDKFKKYNFVADWKTSATVQQSFLWQCAAYSILAKENLFKATENFYVSEMPMYSSVFGFAGTPDVVWFPKQKSEFITACVLIKPDHPPVVHVRTSAEVKRDWNDFLSILNTFKLLTK